MPPSKKERKSKDKENSEPSQTDNDKLEREKKEREEKEERDKLEREKKEKEKLEKEKRERERQKKILEKQEREKREQEERERRIRERQLEKERELKERELKEKELSELETNKEIMTNNPQIIKQETEICVEEKQEPVNKVELSVEATKSPRETTIFKSPRETKPILKFDNSNNNIGMDRSPRDKYSSPKSERKSERKVVINESQNTVKIIEKHEDSNSNNNVIEKIEKTAVVKPELSEPVVKENKVELTSDGNIVHGGFSIINTNNNTNNNSPKSSELVNFKSPRKNIEVKDNKEKDNTTYEQIQSKIQENRTPIELPPIKEDKEHDEEIDTAHEEQKETIITTNNNSAIQTSEKEFNKLVEYIKNINYEFLEFVLERTKYKNIIKVFGARLLSNNGVILYLIFDNEYLVEFNKFYESYNSTKFSLYDIFSINHNENKYFNDKVIVTEYYQKENNDIEKEFRSKTDKLYQISINDSGFNTTTCKLCDYKLVENKLTYKIETVCKYESHIINKNVVKLSTNIAFENYYINETNANNFKNSLKKINSHISNLFQLYKLFVDTFKTHLDKNVVEYYTNITKNHPDLNYLFKNHDKILRQISNSDLNDKLKHYHTFTVNNSIYDLNEKDQNDYTKTIKQTRIQTAYLRYFDELLTNCDDEIKVLVNYLILVIKFCDSKTLNTIIINTCNEELINRIKTTYNTIFEDLNKIKNIMNY